jgi:hypothetical protein
MPTPLAAAAVCSLSGATPATMPVGIPVLEKLLTDAKIPLPPRT